MQISVDHQHRELKMHGSKEYPILISKEVLSRYDRGYFLDHWHPEIEFTYIIEGEILYTINGIELLLKKGQGIFCNQNMMHSGKMHNRQECKYLSITFLPKLIYGFELSRIKTKYIDEIVKNPFFSYLLLLDNDQGARNILEILSGINTLQLINKEINELKLLTLLTSIWMNLYDCFEKSKDELSVSSYNEKELNRLKKILEYIHNNYGNKISLEEIAGTINICTNECCRFFKKYMNATISAYILDYRIEKSLYLLDNTDLSITELAHNIGFSSGSYYTQVFRKKMGFTPIQYRNRKNDHI
ncbi:MAG TPA: AraC family transcriptional regulator [Lachnoclostridium sp.]|uniref:AraC family transcriptional regulator n=1 Tax=Lacrimispora sp. TaxID=2719234 RepID=UPI000EC1E6A4|nr:AraC family transcriptional regulator [Lacrimispora sp.]HCD45576.1 AraC family transcriptional regulator [Lachnoclostridium sp.]